MQVKKHLNLLGMKAQDRVTGAKGVITSVSFDLYGCIQAILKPAVNEDGELKGGQWMDIARLKITGKKPVMDQPDFSLVPFADGGKGPASKPVK